MCTVRQVQLWCCCALQGSDCLRCPSPPRFGHVRPICLCAGALPQLSGVRELTQGLGAYCRFPRCPESAEVLLKHYAKCSLASYCIALPWATAGPRLEPPVGPI
jgi:hypothetical protein